MPTRIIRSIIYNSQKKLDLVGQMIGMACILEKVEVNLRKKGSDDPFSEIP